MPIFKLLYLGTSEESFSGNGGRIEVEVGPLGGRMGHSTGPGGCAIVAAGNGCGTATSSESWND